MKTQMSWLSAVVAVSLVLSLSGCGQQEQPKEKAQLVKTIQVGAEGADSTAGMYSGTVKGRYESNLAFQAGGRITAQCTARQHGACRRCFDDDQSAGYSPKRQSGTGPG